MNAVRILCASMLALSLLPMMGCGATANKVVKDQQQLEKLEKEGNTRVEDFKRERSALNFEYGILLNTWVSYAEGSVWHETVSKFEWKKFDRVQRSTIKGRLTNFVINIGRIYEIANHKGMKWKFEAGASSEGYRTAGSNAKEYIKSINAFEADLAAKNQ